MDDSSGNIGLSPAFREKIGAADAANHGIYNHVFKRALDITLIVLSAPIVLTVTLLMALLVSLSGGSPFYSQKRVGLNGRVFHMWKIRSMIHNADQALEDHLARNPEARAEWDSKQKLDHDPRITAVGRILRKTSLDELPQLWNVLRGDMSLVGPRPMMVSQVGLYPGKAYYRLRPGLTGPWQVSKRNESSFSSRAAFDADYEANLSFREDARIILKTFSVVLKATGK